MRPSRFVRLGFLAGLIGALGAGAWLSSTEAVAAPEGGSTKAAAAAGKPASDPNNQRGLSEAMAAMAAGNARFVAKDYAGAIAQYKTAIRLQPKHPLAHYLLGEALLASGNLDDAEVAFKRADDSASPGSPHKPRILFALADVLERAKKLDEAKTVWARYLEIVRTTDGGAFPESGKARLGVVDEVIEQNRAYETVRQRIAAAGSSASASDAGGKNAAPGR